MIPVENRRYFGGKINNEPDLLASQREKTHWRVRLFSLRMDRDSCGDLGIPDIRGYEASFPDTL